MRLHALWSIFLLLFAQPTTAGEPPPYLFSWGTGGSGDGQFLTCIDAAVDAAGNVYVTDYQGQRVQVFSSDGTFLFKWGSYGQGPGQFYNPTGIALDAAGNVYVVEQGNDRVQKFSASGEFLTTWGSEGSLLGEFDAPQAIDVGPDGSVYVADLWNQRIQKFAPDGEFLLAWGPSIPGHDPMRPHGVGVTPNGDVFVSDGLFSRLLKFSADGELLGAWGSPLGQPPFFHIPWGVDSDHGIVVVGDDGSSRVRAFDTEGNHLWDIQGWDLGLVICPSGVALGPDGSLYVVDQCAYGRVLKFGPVPVQTNSQTWGRIKGLYR